jgi:holin-like protein
MTHSSASTLFLLARRKAHQSRLIQIGLVFGLWLAGQGLVSLAHLPVPGSILGLLLLLGLLASRRLSLVSVRRGANWYLAEMLLFFVPTVLAVLGHHELLGLLGLKILAVIVAGTGLVMGVTGLTVDLCYRMRSAP